MLKIEIFCKFKLKASDCIAYKVKILVFYIIEKSHFSKNISVNNDTKNCKEKNNKKH